MKKIISALALAALMVPGTGMAFAAEGPGNAPAAIQKTESIFQLAIDGQNSDVQPAVMVPARTMAEALGFTVTWNSGGTVTLDSGTMHCTITIGKNSYIASTSLEGYVGVTAPFKLSAAPFILDGSTYVPIELFWVLSGNREGFLTADGETISINTNRPSDSAKLPNPITEYPSAEALVKAVGFEFPMPSIEGYEAEGYCSISGQLAQVKFSNGTNTLAYRAGTDMEDNSGDYTKYSDTRSIAIGTVAATLKGNSDGLHLALWQKDGLSYSLRSGEGVSEAQMKEMLQSVLK